MRAPGQYVYLQGEYLLNESSWARLLRNQNIDRRKLTVAIEKDEGDGHEYWVPVEGDPLVLHIRHPTL